jgi:hypothetical protein
VDPIICSRLSVDPMIARVEGRTACLMDVHCLTSVVIHRNIEGATMLHIGGGAFGSIIIDDSNDGIPANVAAMAERVVILAYIDKTHVKVRCAFMDRNLHSRMPLSFTPLLRLKRCHTCNLLRSSRVFALTGCVAPDRHARDKIFEKNPSSTRHLHDYIANAVQILKGYSRSDLQP